MKLTSCLIIILSILSLAGCARAPLKSRELAMRKASAPPIQDDLPLDTLLNAVETEIVFLQKTNTKGEMIFGEEKYSKAEYMNGLKRVLELGRLSPTPQSFYSAIQSEFDFYEVYGQNQWGEVFITSYFAPLIQGSLKKTSRFSMPLYKAPPDMISADLSLFDSKLEPGKKIRGRIKDNLLIPYYTRDEIDSRSLLQGKGLEICWVDPIDSFFLQIQGSGSVDLGHGKLLYLNYAEQNGHPYIPIGKYFKSLMPLDQITMQTMEAHLRKLPQEEIQNYLSMNPSYVFFKTLDQNAITYLGVPATAGRTIATDRKYFPKGALALLSFDKPVFDSEQSTSPSGKQSVSRFVLDQDIGGAIAGGGRVDLFWGHGDEAKRNAGVIKTLGTLYYIAPKRSK